MYKVTEPNQKDVFFDGEVEAKAFFVSDCGSGAILWQWVPASHPEELTEGHWKQLERTA